MGETHTSWKGCDSTLSTWSLSKAALNWFSETTGKMGKCFCGDAANYQFDLLWLILMPVRSSLAHSYARAPYSFTVQKFPALGCPQALTLGKVWPRVQGEARLKAITLNTLASHLPSPAERQEGPLFSFPVCFWGTAASLGIWLLTLL